MTKKAAAGGQSLLISGALKMARSKRPPNNINLNHHHELALLEDTRELHAAIANRRHHSHRRHQNDHHHNESTSNSSTTESISNPSSPALQESSIKKSTTSQTMTTTTNGAIATNTTAAHQSAQHKQNSSLLVEGKNKKLFPQKLWDLINDERYNFCLRWSEDGQLVYLNRDEFEDSYLKTNENQFHTQKAISFVRQMNMYGFRKVDDCYYENDNFKRGCEHLLKNMTRKHPNKTSTSAANQTTASSGQDLSNFLYHKSIASNGVGPTLDSMASLFGAGGAAAHNLKMAHRPMQTAADMQQPVDLRCAIQQAGCSGGGGGISAASNHLQSTSNQNGQDLSHLIESLVAMSQANMLENTLRQHQEQQQQQHLQAHRIAPPSCATSMVPAMGQAPSDDTMDAELDIVNNPERAYYASNESSAESMSPIPVVTPPIDPTGIHISFNVGTTQNNFMNPAARQDEPLSLAPQAASREQQILNTLHLFRLMLQFSAQNPGTS